LYATRYYWIRFTYLLFLSFTKTTFYLYLHETNGLSYSDIAFIFLSFDISVVSLELPTAALGEYWGAQKSFLTGLFCKSLSAFLFFVGNSFFCFCVAEIVSAFAVCCISGSLEAWLMNQMDSDCNTENVTQIFMKGRRVSILAQALGGWFGAILGGLSLGLPWFFVAVGMIFCFSLSYICMKDTKKVEKLVSKQKIKFTMDNITQGYKLTFQNPILLFLLIDCFLISIALASPKVEWLPYLKSYFQKDAWFVGNVWICIQAIQFVGTFGLSNLLKRNRSLLFWKLVFSCCSSMMLLGLVIFRNIFTFIIFYLLLEWIKPYHRSLTLTLIQQETSKNGRLTILSFENLIGKLGNSIGLFLVGSFTKYIGSFSAWGLGLALYVLILPCYFYILSKEKSDVLSYSVLKQKDV